MKGFKQWAWVAAVCCLCGTSWARTSNNLLTNSGFEDGQSFKRWPTQTEIWSGNHSTVVRGERGIEPRSGLKMLRFDCTSWGVPGICPNSQVSQIIDLSKYRRAVRQGRAIVNASAYFNRVRGDEKTDTRFRIMVIAYRGAISDNFDHYEHGRHMCLAYKQIDTDTDHRTWEKASTKLLLPSDTDYVVIDLLAEEDVCNDTSGPEFDGHYVDDVSATIEIADGPPTRSGPIESRPSSPLGTVVDLIDSKTKARHQVQLWQVNPEHIRAGRWEVRMQHAAAGSLGAFHLTAWTDANGDGLPDKQLGRSQLFTAKAPQQWSSWQFTAENGPLFVGNCWPQKDCYIFSSQGGYPNGYVGLGNTCFYATNFKDTPSLALVPNFTNIVVEHVGWDSTEGDSPLVVDLRDDKGSRLDTADAKVYVNDKYIGNTNDTGDLKFTLAAETYTIRIDLPAYESWEMVVKLYGEGQTQYVCPFMKVNRN